MSPASWDIFEANLFNAGPAGGISTKHVDIFMRFMFLVINTICWIGEFYLHFALKNTPTNMFYQTT